MPYEEEYKQVEELMEPILEFLEKSKLSIDEKASIICYCLLKLLETFSITMQLGILERAKSFLKEESKTETPDYVA